MLIVPLIGALASGIWDAVTGEIPEPITVPLIVLGLIYAYTQGFFAQSLVTVILTLAAGYVLYYMGQIGGGDVLLIAGLSAWLPTFLGIPTPLLLFLVATFLAAIFYSAYFMLVLGKTNKRFLLALIPYVILPSPLIIPYALLLYGYIGTAKKEELFVEERDVEKLQPEDVLAEPVDVLPPGRLVLGKGDIEKLKKAGVRRVKILVNLPRLGPFIFLAFLPLFLAETHAIDLYTCLPSLLSLNIKLRL